MSDTERDNQVENNHRNLENERQEGNARRDESVDRGDRRDAREEEAGENKRDSAETTSLLVRNIQFHIRADEIRRIFSEFGEIRDVYIPQDFYNRRPKGFAFVEFFNNDEALKAFDRMQGYELDGRVLSIEVAKDRRKTPEEMRPKTKGPSRDYGGRGGGRGGGDYGRDGGYGGRGGGGYRDWGPTPRDYGRPFDGYHRPPFPHHDDYGYGGGGYRGRSRSRSRERDYDYRSRPDFRGRDDRYYYESRGRSPPRPERHPRSRSASRG